MRGGRWIVCPSEGTESENKRSFVPCFGGDACYSRMQKEAGDYYDEEFNIPVLYFTQVVGLGCPAETMSIPGTKTAGPLSTGPHMRAAKKLRNCS